MGQQQLFTLIAVAIIAGVAMLRGLEMVNAGYADSIHESEIQKHLMATAATAQMWYRRPTVMGGGGRSFAAVGWANLNMPANTVVGKFSMSNKTQNHFLLVGISANDTTLIFKYLVYPDSIVAVP